MKYDLHSHTLHSDGSLTPTELVTRAKNNDVNVLAITDHDNIEGLQEGRKAADRLGIELINGVEISCRWNATDLHVLGLDIDPSNICLMQGLVSICKSRQWRAQEMGVKLASLGFNGIYEKARNIAQGAIVGRVHIAEALIATGCVKDINTAFKQYLGTGKRGFVETPWPNLEEVVSWIKGAGGAAVIAHPTRYKLKLKRLRQLCEDFKAMGGDGIEVVTGISKPDDIQKMAKLANDLDLAASQGSDYHGEKTPYCDLGKLLPMPEACHPIWAHFTS